MMKTKQQQKIIIIGLMMVAILLAGAIIGLGVFDNIVINSTNDDIQTTLGSIYIIPPSIVLEPSYWQNRTGDSYLINSVNLIGDFLIINISYSGGCTHHQFELMASPIIAETYPGQQDIWLYHDANNDSCEALITEEHIINLSPLSKPMNLHLEGWEEPIQYGF